MGLDYEPHRVDFGAENQTTEEFGSLNPNGNIPAIIDTNGPGGHPLPLFESGAIRFNTLGQAETEHVT